MATYEKPNHTAAEHSYPTSSTANDYGLDHDPTPSRIHRRLPFGLPPYASPPIQLLVVSLVCFLCPGMFNALGGMGGGGQVDAKAANDANTALYSTFAVFGFFAGTIVSRIRFITIVDLSEPDEG